MSAVTVFVPCTYAEALALRDGGTLASRTAHAGTAALCEAHGLEPSDDEDADYTALGYAGLAALRLDGTRLVLAADLDPAQVDEADDPGAFGEVTVRDVAWAQVQALFTDDPRAADDVASTRTVAAGRPLAELADDDAVLAGLEPWDLLWYAPQELAELG